MRPDLHAQEQGVEHDHRANGESRIEFPVRLGNELRHHHGNAHGGEDHHAVAACRIVVVRLFAMLEPTHQRRQAEDAVDVEHHRRVNRVAHQRRRGFVAHHDRQDHHFHQHGGEGQDHRAVRVANLFRQQLGLTGHAHRSGDDEGDQHQTGAQRDGLTAVQQPVL
ncbi:hypothetical protein D3C87_1284030 [compost metagenome]